MNKLYLLIPVLFVLSCSSTTSNIKTTSTPTIEESKLEKAQALALKYQLSQYKDKALKNSAIRLFKDAMQEASIYKIPALLGLAKLYIKSPDDIELDTASYYIDKALDNNPYNEKALLLKMKLIERTKCFTKAISFTNKVKHTNSKSLDLYKIFLSLLYLRDTTKRSELLSLKSDTTEFYSYLAMQEFFEKNREKARYLATKSLELDNTNAIAYLVQALLSISYKDDYKAKLILENALHYDRSSVYLLNTYSEVLLKLGYTKEAKKYIELAIKLAPANVISLNILANINRGENLYSNAESLFTKAIELCPDYAPSYFNYAMLVLEDNNDKKTALKLLKQFVSKNIFGLNKNHRIYKLIKSLETEVDK